MSHDTVTPALCTILSGPFKGLLANPGEIESRFDQSSGREYRSWDTHARTRHFLDVFSPLDGWKVVVSEEPLGFNQADYATLDANGNPVYQPSWKFTATLLNKEGEVVGNGSTIQLMNCPMALEIGETRARSKLYTALGLPSSPDREVDELPAARNTAAKPIPKVDIIPIVEISTPAPVAVPAPAPAASAAAAPVESSTASATLPDDAPVAAADVVAEDVSADQPAAVEPLVVNTDAQQFEHASDSDPLLPSVTVSSAPVAAQSDAGPSKVQAKLAGAIPPGLLLQIKQRALKAKVSLPQLNTIEQAQAFLATLVNPTGPIMDAGEGQ